MAAHTILFVQEKPDPVTRKYSHYETVEECLDAVCRIYEDDLKNKHPNVLEMTYSLSELFAFLDSLVDLSCLVHIRTRNVYAPYNKDWIKENLYSLLKKNCRN